MQKSDNLQGECVGDIHTEKGVLHRMAVNQRLSVFGMRLCPECGKLVDVDFHKHSDDRLHVTDKHSSFASVDAHPIDN